MCLGVAYGVLLSDQATREGTGSQVRYVTLRTRAEISESRLAPLVAEAAMVAMLRSGTYPIKRGEKR